MYIAVSYTHLDVYKRQSIPDSPAFVYDIEYAGKSCEEKVAAIRAELTKKGAYALSLIHI